MNSKLQSFYKQPAQALPLCVIAYKDVTDAEDILQDTLIKIWKLGDDWESWENFDAYSMRMIRNEYLNYVKKQKSRTHNTLEGIPEFAEPSSLSDLNV